MTAKSVRAFRGAAIAFFGSGLVFLVTDNTGLGLCFFMLGFAFMVRSTREGGSVAQERPLLAALIFASLIVLTLLIAWFFLLPKFL